MIFMDLKKVDEEFKEVFSNLVIEDNLTELFAVQHEELSNEDLMELEAQSKEEESQEEEKLKNWRGSWHRKRWGDFPYLRRHC